MYLIIASARTLDLGHVSQSVVELLRSKGEPVRAMVRLDDALADRFRELGAEVVVGELTSPADVVNAMRDVTRMFFNTSISVDYLQKTAIVCAAARELGGLEVIVNMSQMTVSQMTLTSNQESRQQRLLWLSEQIMNWSGVPVVHVRPTVLLDNPLFMVLGPAICARARCAGSAVRHRAHLTDRRRGRGTGGRGPAAQSRRRTGRSTD